MRWLAGGADVDPGPCMFKMMGRGTGKAADKVALPVLRSCEARAAIGGGGGSSALKVFVQQTLLSTRAGREAYYHGRPRVRARQDSMCWVLGATPAQRYGARLRGRLSRTSECSGGESTFGWIAASFRNPKAKGFHGARPKVSDSLFRRAAFTTSSRGARAAGGGVRTCLVFVDCRIGLPG